MSAMKKPKEQVASYEMLSEWDEVLLGDKELFEEMITPHISALLESARVNIRRERCMGNLAPSILQPAELLSETLIQAWHDRYARMESKPLKDWLLEVQKHTLRRLVEEEKKLHEPIVVSLEATIPRQPENRDENEFWEWVEPPVREHWRDMIPDERVHSLAA